MHLTSRFPAVLSSAAYVTDNPSGNRPAAVVARLFASRAKPLRHLGLTLAAVAGATTRELMQRAGHSTARAALIYQHAPEDRDSVIAAALSELANAPVKAIARYQQV
jgi:hypothetical protein